MRNLFHSILYIYTTLNSNAKGNQSLIHSIHIIIQIVNCWIWNGYASTNSCQPSTQWFLL